jgi:2-dehydropantoate 2-reductase
MRQSNIAIFGAGSIGCYLGGRLLEGGASVRFLGRPRYKKMLADHGLTLSEYDRDDVQFQKIDFATETNAIKTCDIIALCVKSQDTASAAEAIKTHAPNAWVISFQNGISNLETLRQALPQARISGAVVPFNVTVPSPGRFHRGTDGDLIIGPAAPDAVTEALNRARVGLRISADIDGHLWAKLLVNLNNALNALSGGPLRDGLLQKDYRRVLIAMIDEGLNVAAAEGVAVATFNGRHPRNLIKLMRKPDWIYKFLMDRIAKIDRTARSSMLDDLTVGRQSELDYLQGEIVRRARTHGLDVPVNRAVMEATQTAFMQKKTPRLSGAEMARRFLAD